MHKSPVVCLNGSAISLWKIVDMDMIKYYDEFGIRIAGRCLQSKTIQDGDVSTQTQGLLVAIIANKPQCFLSGFLFVQRLIAHTLFGWLD